MSLVNYIFALVMFSAISSSSAATSHGQKVPPGGIVEKNPNDAKYFALAQESLKEYVSEDHGDESLVLVQVTRATEQLVNGLITRLDFDVVALNLYSLLKCSSQILELPGKPGKDIVVSCDVRD